MTVPKASTLVGIVLARLEVEGAEASEAIAETPEDNIGLKSLWITGEGSPPGYKQG